MDFDRLPRRMLSSWVPHNRPPGEPRMTFARSIGKALDVYDLDRAKWPELAADRSAWRTLLASGQPPDFRALPPQPAAAPLALGRTSRSAASTNAAIAAAACDDSLTTRLGYVQRRP